LLAYLIIAIELAILYTVFWYVFLREPKPYRLRGNAWGAYDGPEPSESDSLFAFIRGAVSGSNAGSGKDLSHGDECGCQAEREAKIRSASAIYEEWHTPSTSSTSSTASTTSGTYANVPLTAGELIRSQARGVERVSRDMPYPKASEGAAQYAPFNPAEQYRSRYKKLPPFLAELGDKLNRINVKLP